MSLQDLFKDADKLIKGEEEVEINSLMGEDKVVGLYFSAHWCPPCRAFTPKLAEWYENFKKTSNGKKFEIVFVSSDKNNEEFMDYYEDMPWLALPYDKRGTKERLSRLFKVSGIPTLILVEGQTGKKITEDGRSIVTDDPDGEDFPWAKKDVTELIPGPLLVKAYSTDETKWSDVEADIIGLYFSAHWCGPCQAFTPQLIQTYNKIRESGKSFEIIFLSSDRDEDDMKKYYKTMPWLAMPFGDKRKNKLSGHFDISGIPSLIIMKKTGELITTKGRFAIEEDPDGEQFPWIPKPVNPLNASTASDINDFPSLIWFVETSNEGKVACDVLTAVAKAHTQEMAEKGEPPQICFFYHVSSEDDDGGLGESLKTFANLKDGTPMIALVDMKSQKVYEKDSATDDDPKDIVSKFLSGKLELRPLHQ